MKTTTRRSFLGTIAAVAAAGVVSRAKAATASQPTDMQVEIATAIASLRIAQDHAKVTHEREWPDPYVSPQRLESYRKEGRMDYVREALENDVCWADETDRICGLLIFALTTMAGAAESDYADDLAKLRAYVDCDRENVPGMCGTVASLEFADACLWDAMAHAVCGSDESNLLEAARHIIDSRLYCDVPDRTESLAEVLGW